MVLIKVSVDQNELPTYDVSFGMHAGFRRGISSRFGPTAATSSYGKSVPRTPKSMFNLYLF